MKQIIAHRLPKRWVLSHFWQPVPEWYKALGKDIQQKLSEQKLNLCRSKLRKLEEAVHYKKFSECRNLIERLCRVDPFGQQVKSLLIGEEEVVD